MRTWMIFLIRARRRTEVLVCSFGGHEDIFGHEHCQLWLVCAKCGRRTAGWNWSFGSMMERIEFHRPPLTELGPKYMFLSKSRLRSLEETAH